MNEVLNKRHEVYIQYCISHVYNVASTKDANDNKDRVFYI